MPLDPLVLAKHRRSTAAIWIDVGRQLRVRRQELRWSAATVTRHGGPTYKTVLKTERGGAARIDLLETHATALGLVLFDVLVAAVKPTAFSADAARVARAYENALPVSKAALREVARALERREK